MPEQKNFINYHVLISHNPSCLNRDDQNMQKRAIFGGVERIRISSQSLKRAMRKPPENAYNYWQKVLGDPSVRTRDLNKITDLFSEKLGKEFTEEDISRTIQLFVQTSVDDDTSESEEDDELILEKSESKKKIAVAPWVRDEIQEICSIVASIKLTEDEINKAKEKCSKQKGKKKKSEDIFIEQALVQKIKKALEQKSKDLKYAIASANDVALWGRMATSGLMSTIDGSLAVAHSITTHEAQPEIDWFTAVDDLVQDAGEVGAGHLDTQEFSSGVFYRYASLNINQLQKNLGDVPREDALEIAKHVFHMLVTVVPTAKQQSFAAHNPGEFAIVSFADQPVSMANAFEEPIKKAPSGGYIKPSIKRLTEYWSKSNEFYALNETAAYCALEKFEDDQKKDLINRKNLIEMENWISSDGQLNTKE